jgi:H+-translocating NAD(P) transhydrogenase subunit alpha
MNSELLTEFTYFVLAIFVGIEVISKVPTILHTPLMSGTNAIHGIILVAVLLATLNVVGGFVVTDRMLEMFKGRPQPAKPEPK